MNVFADRPQHAYHSRLSAIGLVCIHAIALLTFYIVPVFICPPVGDHYRQIEFPETPVFLRAQVISNYLVAYTWLFVGIAAIYLTVIYRRKRSASAWLPAVSNIMLLAIVLFGALSTT